MADAIDRFTDRAQELDLQLAVQRFPQGTRTAQDAADAIGCDVAQIVKSLVFMATDEDGSGARPVLLLTSGANRVDPAAAAAALGVARLRKADADEVRDATGFAIGGTPPFGHARPLPVLVDEALLDLGTLWAAAGTPDSVFPITTPALLAASGGTVAALAAR